MVTTSKPFTLPIPAFNKRAQSSTTPRISTEIASTSTRKRSLFAPSPPTTKKAEVRGRVIEILDDEEKRMKKQEVLQRLSSNALGLVERAKSPYPDEDDKAKQTRVSCRRCWFFTFLSLCWTLMCALSNFQEYKSSLYKDSKLGDDMEATSSRPFASLEHFGHEDDESWTSSPPREFSLSSATGPAAVDAMSTGEATGTLGGEGSSGDKQSEGAPSTSITAQPLQPLAKSWTFGKFFGR
ncbi:hypothetical protein P389DRAFT_88318 [Cystobasidium minutum MCA 4210]|uniref:uncharacterized protein n=1 Tax=Cystobasidium minutum MCA 4210 TaxID=1397322 RepID=UPI0034CF5D74|eukprot:jgi/Rhomi1/88318/CE88317_33